MQNMVLKIETKDGWGHLVFGQEAQIQVGGLNNSFT